MKGKVLKITALFMAAVLTYTGIGSCTAAAKKSVRFKVAKKKVAVYEGKKTKVKYTSPGKVKLKTSDKKIVKAVSKKKYIVIKGIKAGKAKIKVLYKKKKAVIKVTVKEKSVVNKPTKSPDEVIAAATALSPYSKAVNSFGYKVFDGLKANDKNTFISPASIYIALAMLTNGALGDTYNELMNTLGITDLNGWNNTISGYVNGSMDEKVTLSIADSLWLGKNLKLAPGAENGFIGPVNNYYNAEVYRNVLFDNSTVKDVNKWVYNNTNKMIDSIVTRFPANMSLALINAIYFEGRWTETFNTGNTVSEPFYGSVSEKTVNMMTQKDFYYKYFKNDKVTAIEMPYSSGKYAMDIIMSTDANSRTGDVWNSLTDGEREDITAGLSDNNSQVKIRTLKVPRFKLDYSSSDALKALLIKMGMKTSFDGGSADFSKIGTGAYGERLFVDEIIHKTALEVDETGSKAAAVTYVGLKNASALRPDKPSEIDFIVNRPFILMIRDTVSGMILFAGEVNNL